MLRHHFAAALRNPARCPDESIEAVFPYCAGFLVGIATVVAVTAALLLIL